MWPFKKMPGINNATFRPEAPKELDKAGEKVYDKNKCYYCQSGTRFVAYKGDQNEKGFCSTECYNNSHD